MPDTGRSSVTPSFGVGVNAVCPVAMLARAATAACHLDPVKEDKRRVDMLDNFELLSFDSDLGNIPREDGYCHRGVNAEELQASIGKCKYNVCKVNSFIPSDGGPGSQTDKNSALGIVLQPHKARARTNRQNGWTSNMRADFLRICCNMLSRGADNDTSTIALTWCHLGLCLPFLRKWRMLRLMRMISGLRRR